MTIAQLINRPCTITRGVTSDDDFGLDAPPSAGATVSTVCELQQQQRAEDASQGEVSRTEWIGFFPPGEIINPADTIAVDGLKFEVIGAPWIARNPRTQTDSHVEATLRRTAGSADAA